MLTVIAIIGLLAGMAVGLAPRVSQASREGRIRAQLNQISTAIESYHADFGHYPPDNVLPNTTPPVVDPARNPLFYELSGVVISNRPGSPYFHTRDRSEEILPTAVQQFFNTQGFVNAKEDPRELKRPYLQIHPKQYAEISSPPGPDVEVLVVPVPWPLKRSDPPIAGKPGVNPWRYVSTRPTNNATSFDLWAEWVEGNKIKVLSNWGKDVRDRN